ncbi:protoporphyrinogen oxidase [Paenibacillus lupini]|uniref:protoporphyrinogen oxidase n=1 Tax=Paenibacillus lupini TaxID=1450204 RepID=UPI001FBA6C92|nr:protoporphyrinogen oxidase [Paenibacillus lupini]NIK24713.1 oxygen-dependent protoporphyrinogen oxidase [Paenibacillus lupini]
MRRIGMIDRIVVIGGGISGLSSAFYLQREAERQGKKVQITIVDGAPVLGGKINTLQRDGFVIERGPDSFLSRKLPIIELAKELGIENELTAQNVNGKTSYIMRDGKLHPMPKGMVLGIPTNLDTFMQTTLLSDEGKERSLKDLEMPSEAPEGDESLGDFLSRRIGPEIVKHISEPLLAGIYAGDLSKLSIQATFPQFAEAERKYGSLIRGTQMQQQNKAPQQSPDYLPEEIKSSVFLSFKEGLSTMVDALDQALQSVERRMGEEVVEIKPLDDGDASARYEVVLASGEVIPADHVLVTVPAFRAADLLEPLVDVSELRAINYVSVANVVMAFEKSTFNATFDGSGFLVPRAEGLRITACTWTSNKWLHTSPDDKVLLRCYVGRSGEEESAKLPDEELKQAVLEDIQKVLGINAVPIFTEITRLPRSMPQYPVGHLEKTVTFRERLSEQLPGVFVTGAAFGGVGLPDCIKSGKETVSAILATL